MTRELLGTIIIYTFAIIVGVSVVFEMIVEFMRWIKKKGEINEKKT